jgi:hypothetical protein
MNCILVTDPTGKPATRTGEPSTTPPAFANFALMV